MSKGEIMTEKKVVISLHGPGYFAEGFSDCTSRIFFDEKWLIMSWEAKILDMRRIVHLLGTCLRHEEPGDIGPLIKDEK